MSAKTYEICENLIDYINDNRTIATNKALFDYCDTKFSKKPSFMLDIDELNPPDTCECPFIVVSSGGYSVDIAEQNTIFIGCAISDNDVDTISNVKKYLGKKTIEEFERLLYAAIEYYFDPANELCENSILNSGDAQFAAYFPEFHSKRTLTITSERT